MYSGWKKKLYIYIYIISISRSVSASGYHRNMFISCLLTCQDGRCMNVQGLAQRMNETFVCEWIYMCVCIYLTLLPQSGCDTSSIFKRDKAGLNSEFFFWTSWLTEAKEPTMSNSLSSDGEGEAKRWIRVFLEGISTKWKVDVYVCVNIYTFIWMNVCSWIDVCVYVWIYVRIYACL